MTTLPRGVRIDHGYVQVRLSSRGQTYCRNFGKDSTEARQLATIHLSEKRREILLGKFGYAPELPTRTFSDVARLFLERWSKQTTPEGLPKHTTKACANVRSFIDRSLVPFFGKLQFDSISPQQVQQWRDRRVVTILGTSANREQAVLSSIFSHVETWVKSGQIEAFKIPTENPTTHIEFAQTRKRERVLSITELKNLKEACYALEDKDLWEICTMALKSMLRKKDLFKLEAGIDIHINQAKTGRSLSLPVEVQRPLQYSNFRKRWEFVRSAARLTDCQFRDLRKTGLNILKMKGHSMKIMSEIAGHTNTRTTEVYMVRDQEHLRKPLEDLASIVEGL